MNCVKCGAELRDEQKVCIKCGTRTAAGGHFHVEEKEAWKPSRNVIYVAAGVAFVLIVALILQGLRVVPPEIVTKEWFEAMIQREYSKAEKYHAPEFTQQMQAGVNDTTVLSERMFDEVANNRARYTIGAPKFDVEYDPTTAQVPVTLSYPDHHTSPILVDLAKSRRHWLITNVVMGI